mgnify:CR=1 FL=1
MKLVKSLKYLKFSVGFFINILIFNTNMIEGSEIKTFSESGKITEAEFDQIFFNYSIPYEDYDSYSSQFDNFFGMNYLGIENNRNFQDLSVSIDSKEIRDLYKMMLENITHSEKIKGDKEPFYKNKL